MLSVLFRLINLPLTNFFHMKMFLLLLCLGIGLFISGQQPLKAYDIVYGNAVDWNGESNDLKLDIFYHQLDKPQPLVIFMHGGGFISGRKESYRTFCENLSKRGFVVANVTYRQGVSKDRQAFKLEIAKAVYRAQQDAATAIRFIQRNAPNFGIDTNNIIIGGSSAGGVTALGLAFFSQPEWDALMPSFKSELGAVDSISSAKTSDKIKAVINLWGGIADTSLISGNEVRRIPVLLMHSKADENIAYELAKNRNVLNPTLMGSYDIAQRYRNNKGCFKLYYAEDTRHGYGFSGAYTVTAIETFVRDIIRQSCSRDEIKHVNARGSDFVQKHGEE